MSGQAVDLFGVPVPLPAPRSREEFCERFVAEMLRILGPTFDNGVSVKEYAELTAPTYWEEPAQRECGPEDCAREDSSYLGEY